MKWYKRDPEAFIGGTFSLSLEEIGAYTLALDDIYAREGSIPDDIAYLCRLWRVDPRVCRRLRQRLIDAGKFQTSGVLMTNLRATSEVSSAQVRAKLARSLNEKRWKNNDAVDPVPDIQPTPREREKEKKKDKDPPSAGCRPFEDPPSSKDHYAFEKGVIRLKQKDFDQWLQAFSHLELAAELIQLAPWAEQQSNWFIAVSGALAKRNREASIRIKQGKNGPTFKTISGMDGII